MKIDVLTLFPAMFAGPLDESIVKRAREAKLLDLKIHNLRDWTHDRHKTVDDRPFGGGEGMLLKPEPVFAAIEKVLPVRGPDTRVLLMSAQDDRWQAPLMEHLHQLLTHRLTPERALAAGAVELDGDETALPRLVELFDFPALG